MTSSPQKIVYTASARSVGGRDGHSETADGTLAVDLSTPKEMGGTGAGTNPEELFALGYSACFNSSMALLAPRAGLDVSAAEVVANVGFGPDASSYAFAIELTVKIPGVDQVRTQELAEAAHAICPYSKAILGNVPVTLTAVAG